MSPSELMPSSFVSKIRIINLPGAQRRTLSSIGSLTQERPILNLVKDDW
jgi:hypothetical protein